ncbi:MAG: hypothetical protein ACLFT0_14625 [Spirulinaceae cyanobacterium]
MKTADELRHLSNLSNPEDRVDYGNFLITFNVQCRGNAEQVLQNCREVLALVLQQYEGTWPSEEEWFKILPQWFIQQCAAEKTLEEDEQYTARWRTLSREEQIQELEQERWSVMEWVSWFDLDEPRYWFWWDAVIENSNSFWVTLEAIDIPFPYGSFEWLLKASGAIQVAEI